MDNVRVDTESCADGALWVYAETPSKVAAICELVAMRSDSTQLSAMNRGSSAGEHYAHIVIDCGKESHALTMAKTIDALEQV